MSAMIKCIISLSFVVGFLLFYKFRLYKVGLEIDIYKYVSKFNIKILNTIFIVCGILAIYVPSIILCGDIDSYTSSESIIFAFMIFLDVVLLVPLTIYMANLNTEDFYSYCNKSFIKSRLIHIRFKQFKDSYFINKDAYKIINNRIVYRYREKPNGTLYQDDIKYIIYFKNPIDRFMMSKFRKLLKRSSAEKNAKENKNILLAGFIEDVQKDINRYREKNIDELKNNSIYNDWGPSDK